MLQALKFDSDYQKQGEKSLKDFIQIKRLQAKTVGRQLTFPWRTKFSGGGGKNILTFSLRFIFFKKSNKIIFDRPMAPSYPPPSGRQPCVFVLQGECH